MRPEDFQSIKNFHGVDELLLSLPYWTEQSMLNTLGIQWPQGVERMAKQLPGRLQLNEAVLLRVRAPWEPKPIPSGPRDLMGRFKARFLEYVRTGRGSQGKK